MPRGRRIVIETEVKDPVVDHLVAIRIAAMEKERWEVDRKLDGSIKDLVDQANKLLQTNQLDVSTRKKIGLFTIEEAYDDLKKNSYTFSFRAFAGRVERKSIRSVKVGRYRYIPIQVVKDLANIRNDFYTVNEAFSKLSAYEEKLNLRAFIGRVEKGSIPSLKIGTMRLISKNVVNSMVHVAQNYYTVSQAIKRLWDSGIGIKRNAFERRLDRERVPSVKIGGRRVIAKEVMDELIRKEQVLRSKKQ